MHGEAGVPVLQHQEMELNPEQMLVVLFKRKIVVQILRRLVFHYLLPQTIKFSPAQQFLHRGHHQIQAGE